MKKTLLIGAAGSVLLYGACVNGWMDLPVMAIPSIPAAGAGRLFINAASGKLACLNSSGTDCMPASNGAATGPAACELVLGDPGAASPVLSNDNVELARCSNTGSTGYTITGVSCFTASDTAGAGGGSTARIAIHGGPANSILAGDCACGAAATPATCSLNGAPVQAPGARLDFWMTNPNGTDKYAVAIITRQ